jgi:phosphatidylserine decarboxylase
MGFSYLPKWAFGLFIFILLILTMNFGIIGFLSCLVVIAIFALVFRQSKKDLREDSHISGDVVFSPVNGRVVKVEKDIDHEFFGDKNTVVRLKVPFWKELGLFFPATSEIEDVQASCEKCKDHLVKFKLPSGLEIGLAVGENILKILPKIVVIPGDRGKQKMNFGYLPFGGEIKVYIPATLEVLINEKDEVVAGQGILAGIPKEIKE